MKLSSRKLSREAKIELSMTSMIDVVFLLLIFFMTTASFVQTERNLESGIQDKDKSTRQSESNLQPAIVDVVESFPQAGGGRYVFKLGNREMTDATELLTILRQFDNKSDGAFVQVSDGAPFGMAAAAVQACKSAHFHSVSYVPLSPSN